MNTAIFILTILGCGDGEMNCVWMRESNQRYSTMESCQQHSEVELLRELEIEYPVTVAVCKSETGLDTQMNIADTLEFEKPEGPDLVANTALQPMKQSIARRTMTKMRSQLMATRAFIKQTGMTLVRIVTLKNHRTSKYEYNKFTKVF
jgi:hypothetical protein